MATAAEIAKLQAARDDLAKVGTDWYVEANGTGIVLFARDPIDNEPRQVAELPADLPYPFQNFLMRAADSLAHTIGLLDRCSRAYRELAGPSPDPTDFARQCGIKCRDQVFRAFLREAKGHDVSDDVRVKTAIHFQLKVDSRAELNTDAGARKRWLDLLSEFDAWKKVGA